MNKKDMPILDLFPREYKVYQRKDYGFYVLLFLMFLTVLFFVMSYYILSGVESKETAKKTGEMLVIAGAILMVITILWGVRKRLFTFILSFVLLISVYEAEGYILYALGLISTPFSWGLVTMIIIVSFSYWMGTYLRWDSILKILLLIIVAYMINVSGWLVGANHTLSSLFSLSKLMGGLR